MFPFENLLARRKIPNAEIVIYFPSDYPNQLYWPWPRDDVFDLCKILDKVGE
jgi:hypothetical protein